MMAKLAEHPALAGNARTARLESTYFDTIGGRLASKGASLRVRTSGAQAEQTLKIAGTANGAIRRTEWNAPVSGTNPEASRFPPAAQRALMRLSEGLTTTPIASVVVERTSRRVKAGRSSVEVAFDKGEVRADGRTEQFSEIELELAKGRLADLLTLVAKLPLGPELAWSTRSKADRCFALAFDRQPRAVTARRLALGRSMNVAQGFRAIAWACLEQLLANYPLVIAGGDAGAVHQCRVAIRRLRAAFSLFGAAVDDEALAAIDAELKSVARVLAPVRDLDVLLVRFEGGKVPAEIDELRDHLKGQRLAVQEEAIAVVSSPRFQQLLFELAHWIEAGAWQAARLAKQPLAPFAIAVLKHRRRKLLRTARKLRDLSETKQHRLRIATKKLRYGTEFFAILLAAGPGRGRHKPFHTALVRLQEYLGELNDLSVANTSRSAMFPECDPILSARLEALLDEFLASQRQSAKKLLKRAERAIERLDAAPAWWKPDSAKARPGR